MVDIIITFFITSGIGAVILSYILQAKKKKKEKAEEAYHIVAKTCSVLLSGIRATKARNDEEITEEQYLKEVERFQHGMSSTNISTLSAIVSFNFPTLISHMDELSRCCAQLCELADKQSIGKNPILSSELDKLAEKIQSSEMNFIVAIVREGYK